MGTGGFSSTRYSNIGHAADDASPPRIAVSQVARSFVPVQLGHNVVLELHRDEDDLGAGSLGHVLKSLQLPDLHGRWRGQDIGSLSHESGRIYLRTGSDNFGFTKPLLLRSRGKRGRNLWGEDDILDEDTFDGNAPFVGDVTNDFRDFESDSFAFCHDALDSACTNDMTEGGLRTLHEGLAKVGDTEGSPIWVVNLEVDDRVAVREVV